MTRDDPLPSDREEVADRLIQRLQSSGIQLPETFKPKMKRRIAEAARKGERQRKAAILEQAGRQVERVTQRLRNDSDLMQLARSFVDRITSYNVCYTKLLRKDGLKALPAPGGLSCFRPPSR